MRPQTSKKPAATATTQTPFFNKGDNRGMQHNEAPSPFFPKTSDHPPALQAKTAINEPNDKREQETDPMAGKGIQRLAEGQPAVSETAGTPAIQADWQIGDFWPSDNPPTDGQCHVILGGRRIDHWSGWFPAMRHLYIDYYLNSTDYGVIEAGPVPSSASMGGGTSGAWVKPSTWESRGVQWDITPTDCPAFIDCLKTHTATYHAAGHPYHATSGPNSNSFAWWVLNECGVNVNFLLSSYPYLGYDYWQTHTATSATPAPAPVPATP